MDISEGFSLLIFSISAKKKTFAENLYLPYLANPKTFLENTFFILKPSLKDMTFSILQICNYPTVLLTIFSSLNTLKRPHDLCGGSTGGHE